MKIILTIILLLNVLTNNLISQDTTICALPVEDTIYVVNSYNEWDYSIGVHSENAIVIPIVVHIMRDVNASQAIQEKQNISDAQIISQINVLNEDFRKLIGTTGYGDGVDMKIEFRLADRDPNNNLTTGITRHAIAKWNYVVTGTSIKGSYLSCNDINTYLEPVGWNSDKYFNIWVVPAINSGNLKGIGIFPWHTCNIDGVIIDYKYFGDAVGSTLEESVPSTGRTGTHEVGHYLGLYHLFQGGCVNDNCEEEGDAVCDTPPQDNPLSCNATSACQSTSTPLVENYMQYSGDACMNMFTEGQSVRVNKIFNHYRSMLNNQDALTTADFIIFGIHEGEYDYNVTTRIVAKSSSPYSSCDVKSNNTMKLRARQEIVFEPGFIAEYGCNIYARIDPNLPSFPKRNYPVKNNKDEKLYRKNIIKQIIPNPISNEFHIHYFSPIIGQYTIKITDFYGRSVQPTIITDSNNSAFSTIVNTEDLPSGTYLLHIKTEFGSESQKIIITH